MQEIETKIDKSLLIASEILLNFKSEEPQANATTEEKLQRKLTEWQACYAKLFNDMVEVCQHTQEILNKPVDIDAVANKIEARMTDYGFKEGDCSITKVAVIAAQSAIGEINRQKNSNYGR
jgi:hypothetical protein